MTDTLDKLVRTARARQGLTQDELAKATGTTVSRISRIERASELLGFSKSQRLARALGLEHRVVVAAILRSLLQRAGLKYDVLLHQNGQTRRRPRAGAEVARLRYAKGVSVRQLASKAGMLPSRVAKVENDPALVLQPHTAVRFATALGASKVGLAQLALQDLLQRHRLGKLEVKLR
jgi:transcriptional regulator with XRE-family HTH domain